MLAGTMPGMAIFKDMDALLAHWRSEKSRLHKQAEAVRVSDPHEYCALSGEANAYASGLVIYADAVVRDGLPEQQFALEFAITIGSAMAAAEREPLDGGQKVRMRAGVRRMRAMFWEAMQATVFPEGALPEE